MVSEDRRQGAFLAHFSRPVTRLDYILGKLVALLVPLLFVTSANGLLVLAADAAVTEETLLERVAEQQGGSFDETAERLGYGLIESHAQTALAVLAWSAIVSLATAGIVLGLSALTTRARLAGVAWFAVVAFGWAAHNVLQEIMEEDWPALLSWQDNMTDLSSRFLGLGHDPQLGQVLEFHWTVRAAIPLALGAVGILLVHEQLRRAEGGMR